MTFQIYKRSEFALPGVSSSSWWWEWRFRVQRISTENVTRESKGVVSHASRQGKNLATSRCLINIGLKLRSQEARHHFPPRGIPAFLAGRWLERRRSLRDVSVVVFAALKIVSTVACTSCDIELTWWSICLQCRDNTRLCDLVWSAVIHVDSGE